MAELISAVKDALLKRQEVERLTGLGRSAIYSRLSPGHRQYDPSFPKPVSLGGTADRPTCVRWVASEVSDWIESRIAERDQLNASGQEGIMSMGIDRLQAGADAVASPVADLNLAYEVRAERMAPTATAADRDCSRAEVRAGLRSTRKRKARTEPLGVAGLPAIADSE